ncbi:hypothetical protein N8455_00660 [Candidatus Gracilibacteria bacterium]|nr:hypothetical protein [Candidatus Gracilibacteria bacterium]
MSIHLRKFLGKILLLSTILGIIFSVGSHYYVNGFQKKPVLIQHIDNTNTLNFQKSNNADMASISVAITTNIGTSHKLLTTLPASIYKEVMSFEEAMYDKKKASDEIIGKNMIATQEYRNVLKTNVKNLIGNSLHKQEVLEAYISQLEYRYEAAVETYQNLSQQKDTFTAAMNLANEEVLKIKNKISVDFQANDADASLENIDAYLEAKREYYFARTYIVYINQFLYAYQQLNGYNAKLLDVLINNKEAIIKDAYVIVPGNGGIESLKALDLLFEEADFKAQN